jgi:hypothetical protein
MDISKQRLSRCAVTRTSLMQELLSAFIYLNLQSPMERKQRLPHHAWEDHVGYLIEGLQSAEGPQYRNTI